MASADVGHLIKEGDKAVLKRGDSILVVDVTKRKKYQLGRTWLSLDGALGQPYGSCFDAGAGGHVAKVAMDEDGDTELNSEGAKDNRNLCDRNDNQKLSRDEIEEMKQKGLSRKDIVEQLVENSATFKEKTEFAQQKYIKKKKKKYQSKFIILKPTIRLVAEMYFNRGPTKIGCLRMDSLSQILTQANIQAHSRVLVVDGCNGLVLAALMEKMGGFGTIIDFYAQDSMVRPAVDYLHFPQAVHDMVQQFPLNRVAELEVWTSRRHRTSKAPASEKRETSSLTSSADVSTEGDNNSLSEASLLDKKADITVAADDMASEARPPTERATTHPDSGSTGQDLQEAPVESAHSEGENTEDCGPPPKKMKMDADDAVPETGRKDLGGLDTVQEDKSTAQTQKKEAQTLRREKRLAQTQQTKQLLDQGEFDALIVAARHQPAPIVLSLVELLATSRPVVVFSAQLEPLEDCYMRLRDRGGVVGMRVSETWQRNYQILPNRTHPSILMSNCSGYLFTATTTTCDSKVNFSPS